MNQTDTMRIYRYNLTLRKEENPDSMCFLMGYSRKHRVFSTKDSCQKKHKTISIILVLQEILETGQYVKHHQNVIKNKTGSMLKFLQQIHCKEKGGAEIIVIV